jgi:hypothetical protein
MADTRPAAFWAGRLLRRQVRVNGDIPYHL